MATCVSSHPVEVGTANFVWKLKVPEAALKNSGYSNLKFESPEFKLKNSEGQTSDSETRFSLAIYASGTANKFDVKLRNLNDFDLDLVHFKMTMTRAVDNGDLLNHQQLVHDSFLMKSQEELPLVSLKNANVFNRIVHGLPSSPHHGLVINLNLNAFKMVHTTVGESDIFVRRQSSVIYSQKLEATAFCYDATIGH
jgi:hypothetical protein